MPDPTEAGLPVCETFRPVSLAASILKIFPALNRGAAYAIIIALWAAIYLPGLGSIEIQGEEIRRIMPGINMLETRNWYVPQFNGVGSSANRRS